jgi:hypothetical protein
LLTPKASWIAIMTLAGMAKTRKVCIWIRKLLPR